MADRAQVTSLEALEAFRIRLILYLEKAVRVLDEISDEITRTKLWVEQEQRAHWEREVRRRARELEAKQQELFSAQIGPLREPTQPQQMAVAKARRALAEAEEKLQRVKHWARQYDHRVGTLAADVDKLREVLVTHMGKAILWLGQVTATLHAYAELAPPDAAMPAPADRAPPAPAAPPGSDAPKGDG